MEGYALSNEELTKIALTRELTDERVAIAAAYWLDCSPHERTEADGIILARYARMAMGKIARLEEILFAGEGKGRPTGLVNAIFDDDPLFKEVDS